MCRRKTCVCGCNGLVTEGGPNRGKACRVLRTGSVARSLGYDQWHTTIYSYTYADVTRDSMMRCDFEIAIGSCEFGRPCAVLMLFARQET
jgi:hypothetical protein